MKRMVPASDVLKVAELLGTLRGESFVFNVEAAVARRVRLLPVPGYTIPGVSLRQFAWGALGGIAAGVAGALGVLATIGPTASVTIASAWSALSTSLRTVARAGLSRVAELAGRSPSTAPVLDFAVGAAGQAALVVCVAMVALTLIVVTREARGRRTV